MGNHEYCVDCGENDFHYGRPCNPEKVAVVQAEKQKRQKKSEAIAKVLCRNGLETYVYGGTVPNYVVAELLEKMGR